MPRRSAARTPVRLVPSSSPWGSDGDGGGDDDDDDEASGKPLLPAAPALGSPTRSLGDDAGGTLRAAPSDRMATYFVAITTGTLAPEDEEYDWYVPPAPAAASGGSSGGGGSLLARRRGRFPAAGLFAGLTRAAAVHDAAAAALSLRRRGRAAAAGAAAGGGRGEARGGAARARAEDDSER